MNKISGKVSVNEFVKRQTIGSGKTYAKGLSFGEIAIHAEERLKSGHYSKGYRDGVLLVHAASKMKHHFICPLIKINERTKLRASIVKRRPDEDPYIQIRALNGKPLKTNSVDLILYHHKVLSETNEESTNADWELISFHAIPECINSMPMGPITMMRNQLERPGGTKGNYKSKAWADSVKFWQEYAVLDNTIN